MRPAGKGSRTGAAYVRETPKKSPGWGPDGVESAGAGTEGPGDAASGKLFAGGIRRQEEADTAQQVSGRDGGRGAVGAAGGASATVLPEGRARPTADWSGADATDPLPAAMVWAGRWCDGGCAVRQPGLARLCRH